MTEPMVTDEDREIARRWLSEGQINVDQMGRAAVLVAIRQEYQAALAAEREKCARVAEDFEAQVRNNITKTVDMHGDFGAIYASKRIAAAIRARGR